MRLYAAAVPPGSGSLEALLHGKRSPPGGEDPPALSGAVEPIGGDRPFKKVTEKIMTEFSDLNLCPINNRQGIVIDGEGSKVICKD